MLFNEFGSKEKPTLLLMHGMMQDWHSEYKYLKPLEEHYRLIIPAMDGFYDGCKDFTSFADQARQIEEYVQKNYDGKLDGIYGASQGALMIVEILSRNKIRIKTAILDGVYVAHQGKIAGWCTYKMFLSIKKNGGKLPKAMNIMLALTGMKKEDFNKEINALYLNASEESIKRNFMETYTYRTNPEITKTDAKVYLWCGSKEPYALKSHRILKKYLKNYDEEIFQGYGHGELLMNHQEENCQKIHNVLK
ncbi:MAG: hypothetical protein J6L81_01620 [Clostridia bacterium]|nr:hypothetical protein [Clostridia bacterium]